MSIQLNFINNSNVENNVEVVIIQKNVATDFDERAVDWRVIRYCRQGNNYPFDLPLTRPTLWIGAVPHIAHGPVMNSAILSTINTELNLQGIASADIVMTGGGRGGDAMPFDYYLDNIVTY